MSAAPVVACGRLLRGGGPDEGGAGCEERDDTPDSLGLGTRDVCLLAPLGQAPLRGAVVEVVLRIDLAHRRVAFDLLARLRGDARARAR